MKAIDLNCDLGELEDRSDLAIMPFITSCNIACGGHAGNRELMTLAVDEALKHGVTIGAHPGYADRANFGRCSLDLNDQQLTELIINQVSSLREVANARGAEMKYLKLHGALYHDAVKDDRIAKAVLKGIKEFPELNNILGPSHSMLEKIAVASGMKYFHESFIDRRYQPDGRLVPRSEPKAILDSVDEIKQQLLDIVLTDKVTMANGKNIRIKADSVCIHGDHPDSLSTAREVKVILNRQGVKIKSFVD